MVLRADVVPPQDDEDAEMLHDEYQVAGGQRRSRAVMLAGRHSFT